MLTEERALMATCLTWSVARSWLTVVAKRVFSVDKKGRYREEVSIKLRRTANERTSLYLLKIRRPLKRRAVMLPY
jgi:hypothetical protein